VSDDEVVVRSTAGLVVVVEVDALDGVNLAALAVTYSPGDTRPAHVARVLRHAVAAVTDGLDVTGF
jgi:hypothetical protein